MPVWSPRSASLVYQSLAAARFPSPASSLPRYSMAAVSPWSAACPASRSARWRSGRSSRSASTTIAWRLPASAALLTQSRASW